MEWSNFAWEAHFAREAQKEALYVPVKLDFDPSTYWLQLDTGCNKSVIYDAPLRQLTGQTAFKDEYFVLNGKIGNYEFKNERFRIIKDYDNGSSPSEKRNEIGVLGLSFFARRILTIDYPNERFCVCDSLAELPEELVKKTRFAGVRIRHGKLFLEELRFRDKPLTGIFFDTGASQFTLVLLQEHRWQKLTGKKGNEKDNHYLEVPAWGGEKVTLVGARAKGILKLGDLEIEDPMIYFDSHIPASGVKSLLVRVGIRIFGVNGIMGNAPFCDEYTVILDLQQNRFGFSKSLKA
jgi:hypothetical protein